jgi:hypothetical protein
VSKRRELGDIVGKKAGAGFCGEELLIRIPLALDYMPNIAENTDWCMLGCGDPNCKEYANVEILNFNGVVIGELYHVSECQMEDI